MAEHAPAAPVYLSFHHDCGAPLKNATDLRKNARRLLAAAALRIRPLLLAAALPLPAAAHGEGGARPWWTPDPWVWGPLLLVGALYLRGILALRAGRRDAWPGRPAALGSFCAGMAAVFLALVWPLDALAETSFAAHMAQHMLLIAVAAPLLVLAQPALPLLLAMPPRWRRINRRLAGLRKGLRVLSRARNAFAVHGALVWLWHAPLLFEWALRWRWAHAAEHIALSGSALLFWNALRLAAGRAGGNGSGAAALWTLATLIHTGLLGALITFAPRPLYAFHAAGGALPVPLADQQLAGLLMWVAGGACYLAAGLWYAAAWLAAAGGRRRAASN